MTPAQLMERFREQRRVCPQPIYWDRMFKMLPDRVTSPVRSPKNPLILGGWHPSSDEDKRERLLEHLEWASSHNALPQVQTYLDSLKPEQWLIEGN